MSQTDQVIEALRKEGGYATLRRLNEVVDFSEWGTKTPEASVRRIVQQSNAIFKVHPGLWALKEMQEEVLRRFELQVGNKRSEEHFSHSYYQGLLVEIGNFQNRTTYVPAQDKNRNFWGKPLCSITKTINIPRFTFDKLLKKARTVDVIWFNERNMPSHFYEVEHTTDIKNSLSKFYELQDFHSGFYIVADKHRKEEFDDKIHSSIYKPIENRVRFLEYQKVVGMYETVQQIKDYKW